MLDSRVRRGGATIGLAALVAGLFAPYLFVPDPPVVSSTKTDIAQYFLHARSFAARELRSGNVPLWNPHILAGTPFLGGFQSALFYPPNVLYLALPAGLGINVSIALHLLFAGLAMRAWARGHGLSEPAAGLAGAVFVLCGPLFGRVHAGHLTIVEAAPWVVLSLVAVDRLAAGRVRAALLLGTLSGSMLVLVGHPQTAFFGGIAAGLWAALRLPAFSRRGAGIAALVFVPVGAAALSAIQWWPAMVEAPESFREKLTRDTAAGLSLPLDALATLVAPRYFGAFRGPYWGDGYPWEVTLFLGAVPCVLAVYGAAARRAVPRGAVLAATGVLFLLALGANGPLFGTLFEHVPGFDRFRAWSRFSLPLAAFGALLAGSGLERILAEGRPRRACAMSLAVLALVVAGAGLAIAGNEAAHDAWSRVSSALRGPLATNDPRLVPGDEPRIAAKALVAASVPMLLAAGALAFVPRRGILGAALGAIALGELLAFAIPLRGGFSATVARFDHVADMARARGEGTRVLNTVLPNSAMSNGVLEVLGYDPAVLRRTSAFHEELTLPMSALLRVGTIVALEDEGTSSPAVEPPLPRLVLYGTYEYASSPDAALAKLGSPAFDFRRSVVLEAVPSPRPVPGGAADAARVVRESTDRLEIEASVPAPAILLVTDAWHPFWRAETLPGSAQARYDVLPADGMLRAVPLAAGVHRFRMEYRIPGFAAACGVSLATWALWVLVVSISSISPSARRFGA